MIKNPTVFVVGAGASKDLGLPLGPELKSSISKILSGKNRNFVPSFRAAIEKYFSGSNLKVDEIIRSLEVYSHRILTAASIDNFLDQRRDDVPLQVCCKMAILYCIADAERNSRLSGADITSKLVKADDYFLYDLLNIAVRGHQPDNLQQSLDNLTFIVFNYDRCIEYYLYKWLEFQFGAEYAKNIKLPKIIHVYGSYFQNNMTEIESAFQYEGEFAFQNPHIVLPDICDSIKTFTEQEDSRVFGEIQKSMAEARTVAFIGFGFEEQNMRFFNRQGKYKTVFSTVFNMSEQNKSFLIKKMFNHFEVLEANDIFLVPGKAKKLFEDCYFPLTSAVGSI